MRISEGVASAWNSWNRNLFSYSHWRQHGIEINFSFDSLCWSLCECWGCKDGLVLVHDVERCWSRMIWARTNELSVVDCESKIDYNKTFWLAQCPAACPVKQKIDTCNISIILNSTRRSSNLQSEVSLILHRQVGKYYWSPLC